MRSKLISTTEQATNGGGIHAPDQLCIQNRDLHDDQIVAATVTIVDCANPMTVIVKASGRRGSLPGKCRGPTNVRKSSRKASRLISD